VVEWLRCVESASLYIILFVEMEIEISGDVYTTRDIGKPAVYVKKNLITF
jgi:uncharacterized membrane protein YcgQ (UPF0703/DUF1980 family)